MAYLLDTCILARLANASDRQYAVADDAVTKLHLSGEVLHVTAQNLVEFRNLATRPKALNGLGLSLVDVEAKSAIFEGRFLFLPETSNIFPAWKALVGTLGIIGKRVHDARLVAVCHAHAVTHLLTFNVSDFTRMAAFGPGIVIVDPTAV